jgi:putative ABC transport system permease protein
MEPAAYSSDRRSGGRGLSIARLALADVVHEWRLSLCSILAITVVLAPLLLLFGLRYGVVHNLRQRLASEPANLEIKHFGEDGFDAAWFDTVAALPWVGFVVPRTRFSHTDLLLDNPESHDAEPVEVSLIPSGEGDPVLVRAGAPAPTGEQVVLSSDAAAKLRVSVDGRLRATVGRSSGERRERVRLDLRVSAVLPLAAARGTLAYVAVPLLVAIEDYREWQAVPRFGWSGRPPVDDTMASFRLYARSIDDVEPLRRWLRDRHLDVESAADRIAAVKRIDRDLGTLFAVLLLLAIVGYVLSLALNLLANVARKHRELAILRLVGFTTRDLMFFPLVQGLLAGGVGSVLAIVVFLVVQPILDSLFADALEASDHLARLEPEHAGIAVVGSLLLAAASAVAASWRAVRVFPARSLRDG